MGEKLIQWYEEHGYSFYNDLEFDEDREIYPEDDVIPLIDDAINFAEQQGTKKRFTGAMEDNFREVIERRINPEWQKIADKNIVRFQDELNTQKELVKELYKNAKTSEEQREYSKQLKNINRYSYAGIRSGEARRAKKAFRTLF